MTRLEHHTLATLALALLFFATVFITRDCGNVDDRWYAPRRAHAQEINAGNREPAQGADLGGSVPANGPDAATPTPAASGRIANDETVLVLAIAFVAEADWDAAREHAALAHALSRRAATRGVSLLQHTTEYVAAFDARVDTPRSRWLRELNLQATKPEHWPRHVSWSAHVGRWLACIERARVFLDGDLADPCGRGVEHWGGVHAGDTPSPRLVIAACSASMRNTFYALRGGRR